MAYTMKEAARLSGLPLTTLRHYGRIGLLDFVARSESGYRLFTERDVMLLRILVQLTDAGVSLAEARRLSDLTAQGDETLPERLEFFREKKSEMERSIDHLRAAVESLDGMCRYYERAIDAGGEAAVRDPALL